MGSFGVRGFGVAALLTGCGPGVVAEDTDEAEDTAQAAWDEPGPQAVAVTAGEAELPGCDMAWDLYAPEGVPSDTLVVLSHGFARSRAQMADHGAHLASWGLHTVTPGLCHASPFDTDHAQNGRDLVGLAEALGYARVVYAGHSAGGLASLLAGAQDPQAVGVFALDGVDSDDLGLTAAAGLQIPLGGLVAEASACNSDNNGAAWYAAAGGRGLRVIESDHCSFESPTDGLCTGFCDTENPTFPDDALAETVRALTTSWLLWRTGAEPGGEGAWAAGADAYEALVAAGRIAEL